MIRKQNATPRNCRQDAERTQDPKRDWQYALVNPLWNIITIELIAAYNINHNYNLQKENGFQAIRVDNITYNKPRLSEEVRRKKNI